YLPHSAEWANLLLALRGDPSRAPQVAVMMRNNLEFLDVLGGTALSGGTLFGINTGLAGETLAKVLEQSTCDLLVVDDFHKDAVAAILPGLSRIDESRVIHVCADGRVERLEELRAARGAALAEPPSTPELTLMTPWVVIYTSGTTGLPKGILNSHAK